MTNIRTSWFRLAVSFLVAGILLPASVSLDVRGQTASDRALSAARRSDAASRDAGGKLSPLGVAEHMRRASIYSANRAFSEAREHWQAVIDHYPQDPRMPEAMFGIGRSLFQAKHYEEAFATFDRLAKEFGAAKEGREGLNYSAAALLRLGRFDEAADRYSDYVTRYPNGERIETAYLNMIDTLREAGRPRDALGWVSKTKLRFAGTPTETNAVFAQLRLEIAEGQWTNALATAAQLRPVGFQRSVATTAPEVAYLKAFSLERAGRKDEAFSAYASVPDGLDTYYGWLATERMRALADGDGKRRVEERVQSVNEQIADRESEFPVPYRHSILKFSRSRKLDPRFVLALMKQESVFRPTAKSPAGARGLLQLTMDAARKYAPGAGLSSVNETELYQPEASIRLGVEYLAQLSGMFPQMFEAVAASYNGGEDNVARWLKRARHKDRGVFTAEVGFDETKSYVQKVMSNYRAYCQLYTIELVRK
jgi:soluble lytic murein transglycosylase